MRQGVRNLLGDVAGQATREVECEVRVDIDNDKVEVVVRLSVKSRRAEDAYQRGSKTCIVWCEKKPRDIGGYSGSYDPVKNEAESRTDKARPGSP